MTSNLEQNGQATEKFTAAQTAEPISNEDKKQVERAMNKLFREMDRTINVARNSRDDLHVSPDQLPPPPYGVHAESIHDHMINVLKSAQKDMIEAFKTGDLEQMLKYADIVENLMGQYLNGKVSEIKVFVPSGSLSRDSEDYLYALKEAAKQYIRDIGDQVPLATIDGRPHTISDIQKDMGKAVDNLRDLTHEIDLRNVAEVSAQPLPQLA